MKNIIFLLILFWVFTPIKVYAVTDYNNEINIIADEYNVDVIDVENISFENIIQYMKESTKDKIAVPLELTIKLLAVIIMYSISKAIYPDNTVSSVSDSICTLIVFINLLTPLKNIIQSVSENLYTVRNFMVSFLPVYSGITMASGEFITSTIYTGFFLTAIIFISNLCFSVIIPSIKVYFALIISDSLSEYIRLKSLGDFYIKAVKNVMKMCVSVICFLLTLQTTISTGKDTLAVKAGKFMAGTAIPIIGSSLQEAIGSVYAGMEVIKGYAGAVGLSGIVLIFVPSLISLSVYWICTNSLHIAADMFDAKPLEKCINGFVQIIELIIAVVFLYMTMIIFSLSIMITITNGV